MKKFILPFLFLVSLLGYSQKNKATKTGPFINVPFTPEKWEFAPGKVEFIEHKGVKAVRLNENSGEMIFKDLVFKNGIIEFDVEVNRPGPFPSVYFRWQDGKETELVYLRTGTTARKNAVDAVQYTAVVHGVNLWDLSYEYQSGADIKINEWNHIKMVASGKQLKVFVNSLTLPNLEVPCMETNIEEGKIGIGTGFPGQAIFANLVVKPNETEGLSPLAAPDITQHDTRYIRTWQVSALDSLPSGRELTVAMLPKPEATWETIQAERRGLVNLSRKFGNNASHRKYVWLRAKIKSDVAQTIGMRMGFSDEVWVFVNRQIAYVDKNIYFSVPMRKSPHGRISLDNCSFPLSLKQGENELLIGIANDFFGWGIMSRLEHVEGIEWVSP